MPTSSTTEVSSTRKIVLPCRMLNAYIVRPPESAAAGFKPTRFTEYTGVALGSWLSYLRVWEKSGVHRKYLTAERIAALNSIGMIWNVLDYYWEKAYAAEQKKLFEHQMALAAEAGMPVIIHDREAHGDTFDIIKKYEGKVTGVMHCYSGHAELAREYVKMGWYVSFTGVITYKNAQKTVESARAVPLDRILVETDCPYLAPVPKRSKMNHSGLHGRIYRRRSRRRLRSLRGSNHLKRKEAF